MAAIFVVLSIVVCCMFFLQCCVRGQVDVLLRSVRAQELSGVRVCVHVCESAQVKTTKESKQLGSIPHAPTTTTTRNKQRLEAEQKQDNWETLVDESSGREYYLNKVTNKTSWTKPACLEAEGGAKEIEISGGVVSPETKA